MRRLLPLLALLLTLPGCGLFFVEATDTRVCKTVYRALFAPGIRPPQQATQTVGFDHDFGAELLQLNGKSLQTEIRILDITFTSSDQVTDLAFIDTMKIGLSTVTVGDGGTPTPGLQVLSYAKAAGTDPGISVTLKGNEDYDITPYVQKGALHLTATVSGTFPGEAWAVDMTTCLSVKVHYTYL